MLGSEMIKSQGENLALSVSLVLWVHSINSQVVDNVPLAPSPPVIAAMASTAGVQSRHCVALLSNWYGRDGDAYG